MKSTSAFCLAAAFAAAASAPPAFAVQTCELGGQHVNPANGNTTQGKSGLMRCREQDTGAVVREQELQNGKFMGVLRYFKAGQVEREHSVDERGNRDGIAREWNVPDSGGARVLIREETYRDGRNTGVARSWYANAQRQRLTFYGDDDREQASVEFGNDGKLSDLRCASRPVFGADFDDKSACGFAGAASTVLLYGGKRQPVARIVIERGERRKVESLWENGAARELRKTSAAGVLERRFAADGTLLREVQSVPARPAAAAGERTRHVKVLEQEFHESGKRVHELRWLPNDDSGAERVSESRWYLNGQPKSRTEHEHTAGRVLRRETNFHDNGKPSFEGAWSIGGGASGTRHDRSERATGVHKGFDEQGRLRSEQVHDERGRVSRERVFDERGALLCDDELFEDGSRKSSAR